MEKLEDLIRVLNNKYQRIVFIADFNTHYEIYTTGLRTSIDLFDKFVQQDSHLKIRELIQ